MIQMVVRVPFGEVWNLPDFPDLPDLFPDLKYLELEHRGKLRVICIINFIRTDMDCILVWRSGALCGTVVHTAELFHIIYTKLIWLPLKLFQPDFGSFSRPPADFQT